MAKKNAFSWWKWTTILGVVAALGGGTWYYVQHGGDDAPQFQTAVVSRGDLVQAVTATGTLNPVLNVQVGSQISGIIQELFANFNSKVSSNQVIARLDPATYQANVMSAEADLANARAQLELAQLNARRSGELLKNKLVAQSEYDQTVASLHQAEAQVQIKSASLNRARVDLGRCTIYAPVDGIVIDRRVDVGQTVAASMSAPVLFLIANDLTKMQIHAYVSEADVGTIEEGQQVNFLVDAFPGRTFTGNVIQIRNSPTTVQNVVTYDTVIEVSNDDLKLKPGMTANVSIVTAQGYGVLRVANSAFRFKPSDTISNLVITASSAASKSTAVATAEPALTGNEPPAELQKRVSEMRGRGEENPPANLEKLREQSTSGMLQRPAGGRRSAARGEGGGGGTRVRSTQASFRTVHLLVTNESGKIALQAVRIKTGINDGMMTEVLEGLKENDKVVTGVIQPNAPVVASPAGNPFGGMSGSRRM